MPLDAPLSFRPAYKNVLWGGRRLERWRGDLPEGPVGESWDLADHPAGMSVVAEGPLAGATLRELVTIFGAALVGAHFDGGVFPLMIKLIDATDKLSVQVHPDDAMARRLGVADNGKTECWLVLDDGGELYQGTRPGVDRSAFERAVKDNRLEEVLNRFEARAGDCFFMAARTVHALGAGCLVYELQQTLDVTFRVSDWGRLGPDGKPRPLHLKEALDTIDFSRPRDLGPRQPAWTRDRAGEWRGLADCAHFHLEERRWGPGDHGDIRIDTCQVLTCLAGKGTVVTSGGSADLTPAKTVLVPAAVRCDVRAASGLRLAVATPVFPG
jgi:mannose-6-phosphate isomerase